MTAKGLVHLLLAAVVLQATPLLAQEYPQQEPVEPNLVNSGLQLFGGLAVPLGEFAESEGGAANTGYAFGAQYTISLGNAGEFFRNTGIALGASYTGNGTDFGMLSGLGLEIETGSYSNIWALGGLKTTFPASEDLSIDLAILLGAVFSSSPEVKASGSGAVVNVSSGSATAFALSLAGDVVLGRHFTFGLRYYAAEPRYSIHMEGSGPGGTISTTEEVEQPTSILAVCVGYLF